MRLVDAEKMEAKIDRAMVGHDPRWAQVMVSDVYEMLDTAPTIDPVLAAGGCYCERCGRYRPGLCPEDHGYCEVTHDERSATDFCSRGVAKDEES